ncbi:tRNA(His) guanylyltransferase 2 [Capsicum annuum]|nr:tRNA(His) guanylyltransferase 2 [Capsicum annuum]
MANSKYEYVKCFEVEDEVMYPNIIVVQIDGRDFGSFSEKHGFEKSNDEKSLNLMNACAIKVLESFSDIIFAYGFSDEYRYDAFLTIRQCGHFLPSLKGLTMWYNDLCSFVLKKETTFYQRRARSYKQSIQYLFVEAGVSGKSEKEAKEILKVDDIVKYRENGTSVKRPRKKAIIVHSENVATKRFWNNHSCLTEELGSLTEGINKIKPEYLRSFQFESSLMLSTWIVVRVDGCHFHRFCEDNGFQKHNDEQALKLMNSCAVSLLEMFKDIIFAYGVSDEYSKIVSAIVSLFSSMYVMKWKEFFPEEFKKPPYFDVRSVCCPSSEILRDYLFWRQVDCHINNQYNTCFWLLVKSVKSKTEAQSSLKVWRAKLGINISGTRWEWFTGLHGGQDEGSDAEMDEPTGNDRVVVEHCNIIETSFWKEHPRILLEEEPLLMILRPHGNKMLRLS